MSVHQKSPDWLDKLTARLKKNSDKEAAVGFPKQAGLNAAHYDDGSSIVDVAIYNNFGTRGVPRRAFMELASKSMQPKYNKMMKEALPDINSGKITVEAVLKKAAKMGEDEVRKSIAGGQCAPNAPSTIARKGSSQPLIDSGDMYNHVVGLVRDKG